MAAMLNTPGHNAAARGRWLLRGGVAIAPAALLIVLELVLRATEPAIVSGESWWRRNPAGMPLFEVKDEAGGRDFGPSPPFRAWGMDFHFHEPKPPGAFRIFALGASSVFGGPLRNPGAFPRQLYAMLSAPAAKVPARTCQVINLGQQGFPLSEIKKMEAQVFTAEPDLIIIYAGHNEFLYHRGHRLDSPPEWAQRLTYRLEDFYSVRLLKAAFGAFSAKPPPFVLEPAAMREYAAYFLDRALASGWDRKNRKGVVDYFRHDLQDMVKSARAHGVRVILCTVASNLRDFAPSGSYHTAGLAAEDLGKWETLFKAGKDAYARGDYAGARGFWDQALRLDPAPAELNFCMGHCLLKLGRNDEALPYFQAAADRDAVRNRAGSDINAAIQEVARENRIPLADVERAFRARAPDGVPGDELFLDYVHPNLEGHEIIARLLLQTMIEQGWAAPEKEEEMDRAASDYLSLATDDYLFSSYYKAASYNASLGRFLQARKMVDKALKLRPGDPDTLEMKDCLDTLISMGTRDRSLPWVEPELVR